MIRTSCRRHSSAALLLRWPSTGGEPAIAPSRTTASSLNLRRAMSVPPVAIDRTSSSTHRPLLNKTVNAPQRHTASAEIPIAFDAPHCPASRGFLPWRFADAGPAMRRATIIGPASENLHITGN